MRSNNYIHGLKGHPVYYRWVQIKSRCWNENDPRYNRYGGRGITMCSEWANDFMAFYGHVTKLPNYNSISTLDRIDNNGNYTPDNLRWTDKHTQAANRGKFKNNTTGLTGVYRNVRGTYVAAIRHNKEYTTIGTYPSIIEAANARNLYIMKHGLWEYPIQNTIAA